MAKPDRNEYATQSEYEAAIKKWEAVWEASKKMGNRLKPHLQEGEDFIRRKS